MEQASTKNSSVAESIISTIFEALRPFGISYVVSFFLKYRSKHRLENFAGNLARMKEQYSEADENNKEIITGNFERIINSLVLANGVGKTTYKGRHIDILRKIVASDDFIIPNNSIRVLDIPSSVGISSMDMHKILKEKYRIDKYMMADQFFTLLYDRQRGCIYDLEKNLLQVKFSGKFFSLYRPHTTGDSFGFIAKIFLFPFELMSNIYKKRYAFKEGDSVEELLLLHPEAEAMVSRGEMTYQKMDVFSKIPDKYDLILTFNLLQKNYFPENLINQGVDNLTEALEEGGLLVIGSSEYYKVFRKQKSVLILLEQVGDF